MKALFIFWALATWLLSSCEKTNEEKRQEIIESEMKTEANKAELKADSLKREAEKLEKQADSLNQHAKTVRDSMRKL